MNEFMMNTIYNEMWKYDGADAKIAFIHLLISELEVIENDIKDTPWEYE